MPELADQAKCSERATQGSGRACAAFRVSFFSPPYRALRPLALATVAAEKALPAAIVRQAHVGGLEERVRNFIATSQASGAFRVGPIG
jgi:hypothetical protein